MVLAKLVKAAEIIDACPPTLEFTFNTTDANSKTLYAYVHKSQIISAILLLGCSGTLLEILNARPIEVFPDEGMFIATIRGLRCSFICLDKIEE